MKKIGIFYGSSTGTTEGVANKIAEMMGVDSSNVFNVADTPASKAAEYELLILGTSTWGSGDLQDDWCDFLPQLQKENLAGKEIALFGCGDSSSFSDTFCNAMGTIYNDLQSTGATFIGKVDTEGYTYDSSEAEVNGEFVGCALDEANEEDKTDERLQAWIDSIK